MPMLVSLYITKQRRKIVKQSQNQKRRLCLLYLEVLCFAVCASRPFPHFLLVFFSFPRAAFKVMDLRWRTPICGFLQKSSAFCEYMCGFLCPPNAWISMRIGNGRNTVSRVLFQRKELTEPHWVLRQTRWVLRKTRWVRFRTQIIGWEELTEFAPRNSVSPQKLTEFGVWNRTLRNRIRPVSERRGAFAKICGGLSARICVLGPVGHLRSVPVNRALIPIFSPKTGVTALASAPCTRPMPAPISQRCAFVIWRKPGIDLDNQKANTRSITRQCQFGWTFTRLTRVSLVTRVWRRFFGGPFGLKHRKISTKPPKRAPFF